MKRSIVFSLIILVAAAAIATGAGTFAYFSDNSNATGNAFTSGTLDVQLAFNGGSYSDNVSAGWSSPSNWAPGDSATMTLFFKNAGSVAAHSGLVDFQYGSCSPAGNIFPKVEVTSYQESLNGGGTWYQDNIPALTGVFDTNADGKLSLQELIDGDATYPGSQSPSPYDVAIYTPAPSGDLGAWGDATDVLPFGNPDILPANGTSVYGMKLTLKFMEDAGNAYQGLSCTMNVDTKFVQVPGQRPWTSLGAY